MRYPSIKPATWAALAGTCAALALHVTAAGGAATYVDLPDITGAQGAALVELARTAMTEYLHRRSALSSMTVPPQLKKLGQRRNAVAVTLRSGGSVMAVEVHSASDLRTNLIVAALQAMRSPRLPDRIDGKVLDALTVEVEVLGEPRPTDPDKIRQAVAPGLTGIRYGSGNSTVHVLPSAAYVLGLSPEQMLRGAMLRSRPAATTTPAGPQVAVFATRHFVGYPNSSAIELYRGKISAAGAELDELDKGAALARAKSIGKYLASHQDDDGRYAVGDGGTSLSDHLYATWVMARLAARLRSPALTESVKRALAAAKGKIAGDNGQAMVDAGSPDEDLAATGLMSLALGLDTTKEAIDLRRDLLAGLAESLTAPTTQPQIRPEGQPVLVGRGKYIALLAMQPNPACAPVVASARKTLLQCRPADAEAALWAFRAGAAAAWPPAFGDPNTSPGLTRQGPAALADDRGGFSVGSQPPQTHISGLAAACMAQLLAQPATMPPATAEALASRLAEARRFCAHVVYQPKEAHFAADPNTWVGAVRATPAAAATTALSCAAAMEALLGSGSR